MNKIIRFIKKHLEKGSKFMIIGSIGAIESLTIQYLLTEFIGIHYLISAIIGFLVGFINNYFLNYYFTFKQQTKQETTYQMEQTYDL